VRRYSVREWIQWDRPNVRLSTGSNRGAFWWDRMDHGGQFLIVPGSRYERQPAEKNLHARLPTWSFAGFKWMHTTFSYKPNLPSLVYSCLIVPDWTLALAALILPGMWLATRRAGARRTGFCSSCGYNLTGNTSGICPECGRPTTAGVAT
jgi:hypothetical protein